MLHFGLEFGGLEAGNAPRTSKRMFEGVIQTYTESRAEFWKKSVRTRSMLAKNRGEGAEGEILAGRGAQTRPKDGSRN